MLPISSYTIVLYAALLHLIQALILLGSRTADDSIGLHSLLAVIPDRRGLAAALIASSSRRWQEVCFHLRPFLLRGLSIGVQKGSLSGVGAGLSR